MARVKKDGKVKEVAKGCRREKRENENRRRMERQLISYQLLCGLHEEFVGETIDTTCSKREG